LAFDRDGTLKKAEKLLRQGRLDLAIAEYVRVVEEFPRDWSTANSLGELYARAGQPAQAVEQYARIADHFVDEGFYPKAAALYKKILKINPQDEATQIKLADISARQGLLADAKSHLNAIAARRRAKGDRRGAAEMVVRLGTIDPADFDARLTAARTLEEMGDEEEAGLRFKALYDDLLEKGRNAEAIDALKEFVRINPLESAARSILAKAALEGGDVAGAREFLDEDSAGNDPALLLPLIEIELRSGELPRAKAAMGKLLTADPGSRTALAQLGWSFVDSSPEVTFTCVEAGVDAATAAMDFQEAATKLQEFVARVPGQIPALLRLVEVCVDGGLESAMYEAQEQLTDAYLATNQAAEARVIAEDLVAREPWEREHIDRFRRALVMLRVSDPDTLIAERLSGQAPFMARDPFFDGPDVSTEGTPGTADSLSAPVEQDAAPSEAEAVSGEAAGEQDAVARQDSSGDDEVSVDLGAAGEEIEPEQGAPELAPASAGSRPAASGNEAESDEVDLTTALGELDSESPAAVPVAPPAAMEEPDKNLDQVFAAIRQDASADPDFSTQHMTLAKTYLEIGMLDEAMASLQTAARSPRQRFEAAAALGRLYEKRGDSARAIEWLERAAEAQAPNADESRALLYDLGVLLDGAGETSRALAVFLELQSDAGDYRDVPVRIDRLARVQTGG
jgi:tetratricopeptide (TPR) repeat protein